MWQNAVAPRPIRQNQPRLVFCRASDVDNQHKQYAVLNTRFPPGIEKHLIYLFILPAHGCCFYGFPPCLLRGYHLILSSKYHPSNAYLAILIFSTLPSFALRRIIVLNPRERMASFLTELFQSIFTPGPTPTLLVATNVAFACLQTVLLLLLVATYSIHFAILSFLSAGLWWAINWFVSELKAAQAVEDEKKRRLEESGPGEETETEAETVVDTGDPMLGSKEIEVVGQTGELKDRARSGGNKSEISTEDEWERVSENEKDK